MKIIPLDGRYSAQGFFMGVGFRALGSTRIEALKAAIRMINRIEIAREVV